jgi:hypothetical protein
LWTVQQNIDEFLIVELFDILRTSAQRLDSLPFVAA